MGQDHKLQLQRFELKYLITEDIVEPMRGFIRSYLEVDDFGRERPGYSYPVHSVYLDSEDLWTHRATVNGTKNRFKLRLRYYDANPATPVFFEVKRRVNNCILKARCGVRRKAVPLLVSGQLPEPEHLMSKEPRHLVALQRFNYLLNQLNAKPRLHNCYQREAWVSRSDNSIRVTFDRQIRAEPYFGIREIIPMRHSAQVYSEFVVLELKFTTRFPNWLRDMIRHFGLMQFAAAKYCGGVELWGEASFRGHGRAQHWERSWDEQVQSAGAQSLVVASLMD